MPAAVSDRQTKAPEAPLYEQLLGLPARQRPAHDGGCIAPLRRALGSQDLVSTVVPRVCYLLGVGKRSMRDRFVEKTAGEGRQEVLVGASFRDVSVEDALKKR
jgi:hypothetical protein